jgi:internalin A
VYPDDEHFNYLSTLPKEIGQLTNLVDLDVSDNQIVNLPTEILQLVRLKRLDLRGNRLSIPPEIIERIYEPEAILNYYFAKRKRPLNESKLLFLGEGNVGKTSLVQQILHGTFDQNQTKTEGISINQWQVDGSKKRETNSPISNSPVSNLESPIRLNVWDFGGQEIMHATHQFFLTKRSLYLLVLDARLTQEENRVEYWLKIIQSFGGESPVLIVGNKTDQHPLDIDRTGLQKKYPNIVGILETSAATGAGIEALKAEIAKQVDTLPHVRDLLPETWFTVKSKLEELGRDKNFITQDEYLSLCGANDVTDETSQRTLIGFLHDLGVVLHFQDDPRLEALGILNPQWVTNGVYKILNSHELFQNQGTLTLPILNKTLNPPEYPSNKRLFIVDMMKKFELCYDIEPDKSFLIPDLLPKDEPFTGEWDGALAFQYHYNVLPSSIISRFIVRMNPFVHKTVWRSGVVLKSRGNTALVKADTEDKKIYIWIDGNTNTRRDFLYAIRMELDAIHKTIAKIEVAEKVPLPGYRQAEPVDYGLLLQLEQKGIATHHVQAGSELAEVNVSELLDGVRPSKNQTVKVFISYGHDDKAFVQKLANNLAKENIESWWDFDALKGGHDWQKEIQQGIKRCDFFIVVLSPNSVDREWVLKEITYANEYKKKVIPLMLKECERPISIIEKQYIDFEKQAQNAAFKELVKILRT